MLLVSGVKKNSLRSSEMVTAFSARKVVEAMMLLFLKTGWFLKAEGVL